MPAAYPPAAARRAAVAQQGRRSTRTSRLGRETENLRVQPLGRIAQARVGGMDLGKPLGCLVGGIGANELEITLADLGLVGIRFQLQHFIGVVHGGLPFLAGLRLRGLACGSRPGRRAGPKIVVIKIVIVVVQVEVIKEVGAGERKSRATTEQGRPLPPGVHLVYVR